MKYHHILIELLHSSGYVANQAPKFLQLDFKSTEKRNGNVCPVQKVYGQYVWHGFPSHGLFGPVVGKNGFHKEGEEKGGYPATKV